MPSKKGVVGKVLLAVVVVLLLVGFSPASKRLLKLVNGSFVASPYSSLALTASSLSLKGVPIGTVIPLRLANHTGRTTKYQWSAREPSFLVSHGVMIIPSDASETINVPTKGAAPGKLRISLNSGDVYVTVSLVEPS